MVWSRRSRWLGNLTPWSRLHFWHYRALCAICYGLIQTIEVVGESHPVEPATLLARTFPKLSITPTTWLSFLGLINLSWKDTIGNYLHVLLLLRISMIVNWFLVSSGVTIAMWWQYFRPPIIVIVAGIKQPSWNWTIHWNTPCKFTCFIALFKNVF